MRLGSLQESFAKSNIKLFKHGLSEPFSWRGNYSEVCFSIIDKPTSWEEINRVLVLAYTQDFAGHKGGTYRYNHNTPVNFEASPRDYTDGGYIQSYINYPESAFPQLDLVSQLFVEYTPEESTEVLMEPVESHLIDKYSYLEYWITRCKISTVLPYHHEGEAFLLCIPYDEDQDKNELISELDEIGGYELIPNDNFVIFRFI